MRHTLLLLLGCLGALVPRVQAQVVAEFTLRPVAGTATGDTMSVAVAVRGFQDARAVDVRLAYDAAVFEPTGAVVGPEIAGLRVVYAAPVQTDSGALYRVVLSHLDPAASTTSIRVRTLFTLRGRRKAEGTIRFSFRPVAPAIVSRTLTVQPATYGASVATEAEAEGRAATGVRLLGAFPNPFREEAQVVVEAASPARGVLRVFDALGRTVSAQAVALAVGRSVLRVSAQRFAAGLYVYRLDVEGAASGPLTGTLVRLP